MGLLGEPTVEVSLGRGDGALVCVFGEYDVLLVIGLLRSEDEGCDPGEDAVGRGGEGRLSVKPPPTRPPRSRPLPPGPPMSLTLWGRGIYFPSLERGSGGTERA